MRAVRIGRDLVVVGALALSVVVVSACKRSAGAACKPGEGLCPNKATALTCRNGKLIEVACRGPLGCTTFQERANCDDSVASEGETCMGATEEEYACSTDKKRALICKNGKFESYLACRGKAGCTMLGLQVSCDTSVAAKDDPCKVQGSSACAEDQKELLICRDGKFTHHRFCRGLTGCRLKDEMPACDETLSLELDECSVSGYLVCSVDGLSELVCQGGRFIKSRTCRTGCTVVAGGRGAIDCK